MEELKLIDALIEKLKKMSVALDKTIRSEEKNATK